MASRSKGPEPSGLLLVDKPLGVTSHDVVAAVRGALHMRRVGHAGTLDPQASGALVIGFGHGTRLLNYIVDHTKTYEATIRLGQTSTTDDSEGEIRTVAPVRLADDAEQGEGSGELGDSKHIDDVETGTDDGSESIEGTNSAETSEHDETPEPPRAEGVTRGLTLRGIERTIAAHLTGDIEQVPSAYSAVRVNGRHAYELARQGREVRLKARPVTISEFSVLAARNVCVDDLHDMSGGMRDHANTAADCAHEDGETEAWAVNGETAAADTVAATGDAKTGNGPHAETTQVVDLDVRIGCSTGTYIRSLGRDLGDLLGVGGYLTRLRRTRVGRFDLADPALAGRVVTAHTEPHTFTNREGVEVTLGKAVLDVDAAQLERRSLTMLEAARRTMPTIAITPADAADLRFGRRLRMTLAQPGPAVAYIPDSGEVVGIVQAANASELKSLVVFPARP
ncbi:tRNA pseudouridine(55) synthase TruB [Bifidobacterium sp. ESL0763]|uniref:tRNA pseudouridine synthase B n=1 Tax=Bifidobacterium sp. ESL0763 TaxID=2983227 RepID=UPI0023F9E679|nr:tRNA pseudouridine(55) synthase TruB [Bifidobacterium sp. ESL0763]MDF7663470.1 tRNA pseudouridine(55) synthase TruB [Bifidobacterium sp. ESL0763]